MLPMYVLIAMLLMLPQHIFAQCQPQLSTATTVLVSWTAPMANADLTLTAYTVQRQVDGNEWQDIAHVIPPTIEVANAGLQPGHTYHYRVLAQGRDASGLVGTSLPGIESLDKPPCITITASPPAVSPPTNVTITPQWTLTVLALSWQGAVPERAVDIERQRSTDAMWESGEQAPTGETYTDVVTTCAAPTRWCYRLRWQGENLWSAPVCYDIPPP